MRIIFCFPSIKPCLVLLLFGIQSFVFAQTGTISGSVSDSTYKETLPGANIVIEGANHATQSDLNGNYSFKVNPGTYSIKFSFFGYKDSIVSNVKVEAGQTTVVNMVMAEDVVTMDVIDLGIEEKTNTEKAVIEEIKESKEVVSGISSEQINKSQDRDAAQAMQRIPGVTLIDNRFILVRGLSERYNSVMINGAISPSTEVDRRSFAFDLIPSNLLDRMMVYKSGTAELPGDFAGGVIKVYTRNVPAANTFTAGLTIGYRNATTGKSFFSSQGSGTDFLGFDNGYRKLPSDFPNDLNDVKSADLTKASQSLSNNFTANKNTALPDLRFLLGITRRFFIKNKEISTITNINYANTYQYMQLRRKRYNAFDQEKQSSPLQLDFIDDQYTRNVRVGVLSNWSFLINPRNKIEFKNMFNQLGENETIIRNGINLTQRPTDSLRNYSFRYASRSIYSGQLCGNHEFGNNKTTYSWVTGLSYFSSNIPDLRRFRTFKPIGTNDPYKLIVPPTATTFDAARFYSHMNEGTVMNSGNIDHNFFDKATDSTGISMKVGYYIERKSRSFRARWMSYKSNSANGAFVDSVSALSSDQWFTSQNINAQNGFYLDEGSNPTDQYTAQNFLFADYLSFNIPLKKFNIATGVRTEYNKQSLQTRDDLKAININNPIFSVLPFANLSYNFNKKMLVRAAYSKTVNRPEFRELAPFLFYDFQNNADNVGNPNLKTANIHNADLRWEFYPSVGETFSIGGFYKKFINPIESYIRTGADNPIFFFDNAVSARNYGVEVEFRKSFIDISKNKFIQNLSLVFNGSLINSRVDLGKKAIAQDTTRALQGQSPYVLNAGIYYIDEEKGLMVNVIYNVFGKRIFIVGNDINPTVYEMPRNLLDVTVSKRISKNFEARLGIQDLLNSRARFFQDSNQDSKITKVDESVLTFRRGTYFTFGIGYTF